MFLRHVGKLPPPHPQFFWSCYGPADISDADSELFTDGESSMDSDFSDKISIKNIFFRG